MTATTPSGHPVITAVLIELDSSEQSRFPGWAFGFLVYDKNRTDSTELEC